MSRTSMMALVMVLTCLLIPCAGNQVQAQDREDPAPRLFEEVVGAADTRGEADPLVVRSRVVRVNWELLGSLRQAGSGAVTFNLFANAEFVATLEDSVPGTEGRVTWFGTLRDQALGTVALAVGERVAVGSVRAPGFGSYWITFLGDDLHAVREVDEDRLPPCKGGLRAPGPRDRQGPRDSEPRTPGDDGSVLDVLVVYTAAARAAAGGYTAMRTLIDLAVAETNQGYDDSGVAPNLKLATAGEIAYQESGDACVDVGRLVDQDDGFMDEVHDMRDAVGADVVSLIVNVDPDACGCGYAMEVLSHDFEAWAFSAVRRDCATGNFSFGHEIGHNQGCAHDWTHSDPGDGLYDYSHGHRWVGDSGNQWRSVMAYQPGTRVNHYSNPNVTHDGRPTGVAVGQPDQAHNALTINNTAFTVANFRASRGHVVWVDFYHTGTENGSFDFPFNTMAEGVAALQSGGALVIKPGTTGETPTLTKAMTVMAYRGGVTIGGGSARAMVLGEGRRADTE